MRSGAYYETNPYLVALLTPISRSALLLSESRVISFLELTFRWVSSSLVIALSRSTLLYSQIKEYYLRGVGFPHLRSICGLLMCHLPKNCPLQLFDKARVSPCSFFCLWRICIHHVQLWVTFHPYKLSSWCLFHLRYLLPACDCTPTTLNRPLSFGRLIACFISFISKNWLHRLSIL